MKRLWKFGSILIAVVIILLFVMSAVLRPKVLAAKTSIDLQAIAAASVAYFGTYSRWPSSLQDLDPASAWNPRKFVFLARTGSPLTDGWGHAFIYEPFSSTNGYGRVLSLGETASQEAVAMTRTFQLSLARRSEYPNDVAS